MYDIHNYIDTHIHAFIQTHTHTHKHTPKEYIISTPQIIISTQQIRRELLLSLLLLFINIFYPLLYEAN